MSELAKALHGFQAEAPSIQRDSLNPHFRSKYVSLETLTEQVLPVLNKHGVVLMQLPTVVGNQPALRTVLVHAESGDSVEDVMFLMLDKDTPQAQGSAITYARRYALMAFLGLVADEDDDGNASSGAGRKPGEKTGAKPQKDEAGSTPAPDTHFKAPAGKRGSKAKRNEAVETAVVETLRAELVELVTQIGASDSIPSVHEHADAGDTDWLTRQIATAKKHMADRGLEPVF